MDDLFTTYVSSQTPNDSSRHSTLQIITSIPSIQIDSIQDVLRPEDTISIKSTTKDSRSTVLCTAKLTLDQVQIAMEMTDDRGCDRSTSNFIPIVIARKFSASAQHTHLEVLHPQQSTNHGSTTPRSRHILPLTPYRNYPTALDLEIGLCQAKLDFSPQKASIALNGGEARLEFVDEAAELVIGSIWSWRVLQDVAGPLVKRRLKTLQFSRQVVWAIVHASEQLSITTFPTFLNRVSYLVGTSTNLRGDDGWKILSHLRYCLRLAKELTIEPSSITADTSKSLEQFNSVVDVVSRWRSWEIDAEDLTQARFLSSLFGQSSSQSQVQSSAISAGLDWDIPIELEWTAGRFEASLSDGESSDNWMAIGPISSLIVSSGRTLSQDSLALSSRITIQVFDANVDRDLLLLVRHIIKVRKTFERKIQLFREGLTELIPESTNQLNTGSTLHLFSTIPRMVISASVGIQRSESKATAGNLEASAILQNLSTSITILFEPKISRNSRPMSHQVNANTSFTIGGTSLAARDITTSQEPLLSLDLDELSLIGNAVGSHTWDGGRMDLAPSLGIILACQAIRARIPREAIRFYEFLDTWKTETLPTYDSLLLQLRQGLDDIQSVAVADSDLEPSFVELLSAKANISTQLCISLLAFEFQAIPTLAMGYYIRDISAHANTEDGARGGKSLGNIDAGLMIGSQTIRFIPMVANTISLESSPLETSFDIPILRVKAHLDGLPCTKINFLVTIDPISIKLTSSILDNILTVQKRFGNDLDELLDYYRSRQVLDATDPAVEGEQISTKLVWDARVAFQGLRLGLEGPQAIQWIEVELLEGYASSVEATSSLRLNWEASAQNLSISLSQRSLHTPNSDRGHRLAFFTLDLSITNAIIQLPDLISASNDPHLHLRLSRIHAVLQPSAVDALADLVEHFQDELELRRSSQREDINAIRQRVLQTFDIGDKPVDVEESLSWLASCVLSVEAKQIGLAIPLNMEVATSRLQKGKSIQSHPAFLVSLPLLHFSTRKGEAAIAKTTSLAFQFVQKFDQAREEDFNPRSHNSLNSIVFPQMQCIIRRPSVGQYIAHSVVSGIEIDWESSAIGLAFLLIDVYQLSNERFAKYASLSKVDLSSSNVSQPTKPSPPPTESFASSIRATFEFESGVISMHSKQSSWNRQNNSTSSPRAGRPSNHRTGRSLSDFSHFRTSSIKPLASDLSDHVDIFRLPGISVWSEYREGITPEDSTNLQFNISIHSSNNQISPSLIPFISECASQLKARALRAPTLAPSAVLPSSPALEVESTSSSSMKIGITLKLDQSKLDISCQPAAPVTATLTWVSGGIVINISPDVKGIEIATTIDGVAFSLAHDFSPEKCLSAEVRGITANVMFQALEQGNGSLSVAVDVPDISAECNFRHFQDFHVRFCFFLRTSFYLHLIIFSA